MMFGSSLHRARFFRLSSIFKEKHAMRSIFCSDEICCSKFGARRKAGMPHSTLCWKPTDTIRHFANVLHCALLPKQLATGEHFTSLENL